MDDDDDDNDDDDDDETEDNSIMLEIPKNKNLISTIFTLSEI